MVAVVAVAACCSLGVGARAFPSGENADSAVVVTMASDIRVVCVCVVIRRCVTEP